ncbi:PREDICTED: uncharacterized protein LOC109593814 [Amphimedon queenslandica]|uniref:Death domain-containing protein n=1 Tax=Amphimedon queenslandica TaxID=400682 RepID=A0A1X7VLQ9_AMPQE|nr:PREDICTED: uncharacterized protein LOC109593814 [Amphimedon queenslandica]|eukprot:XP_019864472.1 PREDICTED: uncharacterized protein LOC109593814 [Amphimedon queenslandica]
MADTMTKTEISISVIKLKTKLNDIVPDWMMFGIQLGVPMTKLRSIESSRYHSRSTDDKFTLMLTKWLEISTDQTWSNISTALEAIGNRRLACSIKDKYGEGNVTVDATDLQTILKEVIPNWIHFGLMLGIPKIELDIIDDRNPYSQYLFETLEYWKDNGDFTWETLIDAVRRIGNEKLAMALEKDYIVQT